MATQPMSQLRMLAVSFAVLVMMIGFGLSGCEKPEEKVIDVETPGADIEVNRSEDGMSIDIENDEDQP